jgi:two-component system response regulator AlgR
LRLVEALSPDLLLLDMTMPEVDGLTVARELAAMEQRPAVIFVTAHDDFAVEAFDLDAVDYVLKPVSPERLERAISRAVARRGQGDGRASEWLEEFWVPHKSELIRIEASQVDRIDAERDYVRLHIGGTSYLLLQTIAGLEARLDPGRFIRIHRSCILRRDCIRGLRHEGLGVWSVETEAEDALRIGRTYLSKVKAMAGR